MTFSLIVPMAKVKSGKLTISCNNRQGGAFRLMLSLPHPLWTVNFGQAERCDVQIGQGTDAGKLLVSRPLDSNGSGGGGHFKPTFFKTNILLRLPAMDWAPDFKMAAIEAEHRQTRDGLLITLPDWAWNKERQRAIKSARDQVSRERQLEARGGK